MASKDVLKELLVKQEITERLYTYCRGMDRIDNDLAKTVFHPDAVLDYEDTFQGSGYEFVEWVANQHRSLLVTSHQISNILIEVDDDSAVSESYVTMAGRMKIEENEYEQRVRGRYIDKWTYHDGKWAIERRQFVNDMGALSNLTNAQLIPASKGSGRDDKTDFSYTVLESV